MHKENYNINIACFCNENFTDALNELKTFFGFNLILSESLKEFKNENINAVLFDNENSKKILSLNINYFNLIELISQSDSVENALLALESNNPEDVALIWGRRAKEIEIKKNLS